MNGAPGTLRQHLQAIPFRWSWISTSIAQRIGNKLDREYGRPTQQLGSGQRECWWSWHFATPPMRDETAHEWGTRALRRNRRIQDTSPDRLCLFRETCLFGGFAPFQRDRIRTVRVAARLRRNPLISFGCGALAAALVCFGLLSWSSTVEQARSPGEKDLGVAVLAMMFGVPALLLAAASILCLFTGICVWTFRRYRRHA